MKGSSNAKINTALIESLTITPSTESQTFIAEDIDGFSPVIIEAVDNTIDENITAENIKDGVTILGVTGTYEGSGGLGIGIPREVSDSGVYSFPSNSYTFTLPSGATDIAPYGLYNAFIFDNYIVGADLTSLTTVTGNNAFEGAFNRRANITSINLANLVTVTGSNAFTDVCYECSNLSSVNLSSLTSVSGSAAFANSFSYCNLTEASLPSLTTVTGSNALSGMFYNNRNLRTLNLSSLETASGSECIGNIAAGCSNLTSVEFTSLFELSGSRALVGAFYDSGVRSLLFPALTSESFGNYTNQFEGMLSGVSNCTVHFPVDLRDTIENWSDITNGFSGTNTTVLFDLGGCNTTFSITPSSGNRIIVNGMELSGTSISLEKNTTANYTIYNPTYGLYISTYAVPDEDNSTAEIDITGAPYNMVSLNTGVEGLTIIATINGFNYTFEESEIPGIYNLPIYNSNGNNIEISYYIDGGNDYFDVESTLTFENEDLQVQIELTPAEIVTFVRPNLSSNGTMGGDAFAVEAWSSNEGYISSAYLAVDGSSSCCNINGWVWDEDKGSNTFTFYNPDALKVSSLTFNFLASNRGFSKLIVEASNDNSNWVRLSSWNGRPSDSLTCSVNSNKYYKYHRLTISNQDDPMLNCMLKELEINAVYKSE